VHLVGGAGSRTYALTSPNGAPALAPAVASAPGPAGKLSTPCWEYVNGSDETRVSPYQAVRLTADMQVMLDV